MRRRRDTQHGEDLDGSGGLAIANGTTSDTHCSLDRPVILVIPEKVPAAVVLARIQLERCSDAQEDLQYAHPVQSSMPLSDRYK